jgi:hypothetical protein
MIFHFNARPEITTIKSGEFGITVSPVLFNWNAFCATLLTVCNPANSFRYGIELKTNRQKLPDHPL